MLKRIFVFLVLPIILLWSPLANAQQTVKLPIVMYHHISRNPSRWNDYVISEAEFENDLRWLERNGYETISVAQLLAWSEGRFIMPEKPCMITFDDGFESTAAYAEPLLRQYGFCGVSAVIGSVCEKFSELDEHDPELSNLSWEDAKKMAERGVIEVQCHTWDMHHMGERLGCRKLKWESEDQYRYILSRDLSHFLAQSRLRGLGITPTIAFPYGAYSSETIAAVRDYGFRAAFTCTEEINLLTGDREELYLLGRYNRPHGINSEIFFKKWEENS